VVCAWVIAWVFCGVLWVFSLKRDFAPDFPVAALAIVGDVDGLVVAGAFRSVSERKREPLGSEVGRLPLQLVALKGMSTHNPFDTTDRQHLAIQGLIDVSHNRIGNPSDEHRYEAAEALRAVECSRYSPESITAAEALLAKLR